MKKVILIFVTIVLSGLLYAKDNKSTDALLREIDGIIKNRQTYGAEKEARIACLLYRSSTVSWARRCV